MRENNLTNVRLNYSLLFGNEIEGKEMERERKEENKRKKK